MSVAAARSARCSAHASDVRPPQRSRRHEDTFPAGRVVSIDTTEFDEFNQCAAGWSVEHHALNAKQCRSTVLLLMTRSFQVGFARHGSAYCSQGENPAGTLSIVVPVDDARLMVHRGHGIGPMQMGLIRSGEGYECVCRSGARFVATSLAHEKVEQYAADLMHEPDLWRRPEDRLRFVDYSHRSRYLDTCGRILSAVSEQPSLLEDAHAAALVEQEILEALLLNAHVAPSHQCEGSRYHVARQAYRYLQSRPDDVPSIRELCAVTGASYATLERGFRETYGMTPKAMMTAMRLSGARRALLHASQTTTVTSVALRWGFVEFGRFSCQYRERYGEVPSETLRRTRRESLSPFGSAAKLATLNEDRGSTGHVAAGARVQLTRA